jgi:hypothetical protein
MSQDHVNVLKYTLKYKASIASKTIQIYKKIANKPN